MPKEVVVTREGYRKLEEELDNLRTVVRKEVAEKIKVARGYGDLSENAEYDAAKEDPYKMKRKIVRGGSWKDASQNIRADLRTWEYQNEQRSYIGFRNVRSQIGFARGTKKKNK